MENNLEEKSLTDLVQNPSELSAIISDPAESGVKFYQSLRTKEKSYVAFAAGVGLLAYGLYLSKSGGSGSKGGSSSNQGGRSRGNSLASSTSGGGAQGNATSSEGNTKTTSNRELDVKKKNK